MSYVDLGKVHLRARLYDKIPGVVRDITKIRKNFSFAIPIAEQGSSPISYNVVTLNAYASNGEPISGALIPEPIFEPVDNYMLHRTNTSTSATTSVYWKQVGITPEATSSSSATAATTPTSGTTASETATETAAPTPFDSVRSKFMKSYLRNMDESVTTRNMQTWLSQPETVSPERYSPEDYAAQQITYDGSGYKKKKDRQGDQAESQSDDSAAAGTNTDKGTGTDGTYTGETDGSAETEGVEETHSSYFVRQVEAAPGVWWGLETASPFKDKGHPFWVVIRSDAINLPKNSKSVAFLSIILCESEGQNGSAANSPDLGGYVEFIIENTGKTYLRYEYSTRSDEATDKDKKKSTGSATQSSGTAKPKKDGEGEKEKESAVATKYEMVPAPWLSEAFVSGTEIRVGFMSVMGRLCVYTNPSQYHVTTFVGSKDTIIPFNLKTPRLSVYGYGCKASVMACHMTFKKRGWQTMPEMKLDSAQGHTYPENDDRKSGVSKGDCANGRLISKMISVDAFLAAKKNKSDGKVYGAVFHEYQEVDFMADEEAGKARQAASKLTVTTTNYDTGMINPWGKVHIVHSDVVNGLHEDKPFWYVYLETEPLSSPAYTPAGAAIKSNGSQSSLARGDAGFPSFYSVSCYKPKNDVEVTPDPDEQDSYDDVSENVLDISCSSQLDSPRPTLIEYSGSMKLFNADGQYSEYLAKARGIRIWMKWSQEDDVEFGNDDIVYSGIAFGRSGSQAPGEEYITFELVDHWKVLEGIPIKNSPFYDGLHLATAVDDLCGRAGLSFVDDVDKTKGKDGGPLYYFLGYGLAYDKPMFRFSAETSLKDCITNVLKAFELYLYFDKSGKLHMVPIPGGFLFDHTNAAWDPDVKDTYYLEINQTSQPYKMILDGLDMVSSLGSSVYNSLMIMSIDKGTGRPLIVSRGNPDSLLNSDTIGYLGFIKEIRIDRPDLGNQAAAENFATMMINMYSKPGFEVEFNTVGHIPAFRPGQFISLKRNADDDGGDETGFYTRKFRATKVTHSYQASNNTWKTTIGAYQVESPSDGFKPTQGLLTETPVDPDEEGETS
jgi:hypothetical protein